MLEMLQDIDPLSCRQALVNAHWNPSAAVEVLLSGPLGGGAAAHASPMDVAGLDEEVPANLRCHHCQIQRINTISLPCRHSFHCLDCAIELRICGGTSGDMVSGLLIEVVLDMVSGLLIDVVLWIQCMTW
jgi:hypothetical protein